MNLTAQSLKDDFLGRVRMTGPNEDALLNQRLARLTPESITARFAYYVFRSPLFRDFVSTLNTGSLIQHMFRKQIDDFLLPVPPVAAQVRIATHLDEVLEGSSRTRRSCVDVRERGSTLRRALLVGAFLGQLTRQGADADWQAEVAGV